MLPQVLFGIGLVGLSLFLLRMHRGERERQRLEPGDRRAKNEAAARFRRRTLSSALIGVAGMLVVGGVLIRHPVAMAIYWSIAMIVVVLIIVLGTLDFLRSRRYLYDLRVQHLAERAALEAEVAAHMKRRADASATETDDEQDDEERDLT